MKTTAPRRPARLLVVLVPLAFAACAHTGGARPQVASAVAPQPAASAVDGASPAADDQPAASVWLERALEALQAEQPARADAALKAALATGDLNEAGRTLAYWYVYVAAQAQGRDAAARDALADFVAVAEDVLALRDNVRFAERGGSDFVDRFDLEGRLARSRATLSLAWAAQTPNFGRSAAQAVPVQSDQEMAYFLELAPPCAHRLDKEATVEAVPDAAGDVTQVALRCDGLGAPAHYFFVAHKAAPAPRQDDRSGRGGHGGRGNGRGAQREASAAP